jgi:hypothetical protein
MTSQRVQTAGSKDLLSTAETITKYTWSFTVNAR